MEIFKTVQRNITETLKLQQERLKVQQLELASQGTYGMNLLFFLTLLLFTIERHKTMKKYFFLRQPQQGLFF
jgi:hypothetical protein